MQYYSAVSGGLLACMPLELKLRGKSTTMSHRAAIYYVDLVVRSGLTLEQAIAEAREVDATRRTAGLDQMALDEAARRGFANGAFEELEEDVPAVVEEFFPNAAEGQGANTPEPSPQRPALRARLQEKVARIGTG
jgi:hypothetical protein